MKRGTGGMKTARRRSKASHWSPLAYSPPVNAPPEPRDFAANAAPGSPVAGGVAQIARLLERLMADLYGTQTVLTQGLVPPAAVLGDAGFLRALRGVRPLGERYLHTVSVDVAAPPHASPQVTAWHMSTPVALAALQDEAGLAARRAFLEALQSHTPAGRRAHLALLTPGPFNPAYPQHALLAQQLGMDLVEGRDLLVRNQHLYLQALHGWVPVHILLHALDDAYLDPLELRADSTLGVPGLVQAVRAGHVLVVQMPGAQVLQSPALQGCLAALAPALLGEPLALPLATGQPGATQRWVALADGAQGWLVAPGALAAPAHPASPAARPVATRRAGENLYWLGRYTERATHAAQLAQMAQHAQDAAQQPTGAALRAWIDQLQTHGGGSATAGLAYNLRAMHLAATALRERFTHAHWEHLLRTVEGFQHAGPAHTLASLEALAQTQQQDMAHDAAWQLMGIGRAIERLDNLSQALLAALETGAAADPVGAKAMARLMGMPPQPTDLHNLLTHGVADPNNPSSLAATAHGLRAQLARLSGAASDAMAPRFPSLPDPALWLAHSHGTQGTGLDQARATLTERLRHASQCARQLASSVTAQYFNQGQAGAPLTGA